MSVAWARLLAHASGADASGCKLVGRTRMKAVPTQKRVGQYECKAVRMRRGGQGLGCLPSFCDSKAWRPNIGFQRTARCAEQDRGFFDTWIQLDRFPDLLR